jgi:hypothetical protein
MRSSRIAIAAAIVVALASAQAWQGCGNGKHPSSDVTFAGNVANVIPPQAMRDEPSRRWLAALDSLVFPEAVAQSTCPVRHVLACASNGGDSVVCQRVNTTDCRFSVSVALPASDFSGAFGFVDDANDNGKLDQGETIAFLFTPLGSVCRGMTVTLNDVTIDFANGFSTATSVEKDPDTCPTVTPGPSPTPPPGTTPTTTPTYSAGASLNRPPPLMLAALYGVGGIALLLARRRRK